MAPYRPQYASLTVAAIDFAGLEWGGGGRVLVSRLRLPDGAFVGWLARQGADRLTWVEGRPSTAGAEAWRRQIFDLKRSAARDELGVDEVWHLVLAMPFASPPVEVDVDDLRTEIRRELGITGDDGMLPKPRHVLLLRNLDLHRGDPKLPSHIGAALTEAGDPDAESVGSNGTYLIRAHDATAMTDAALALLARRHGLEFIAFTLPVIDLGAILERHAADDEHLLELTVHAAPAVDPTTEQAIDAQRRGRCSIVTTGEVGGTAWAVVRSHAERRSNGTPVVERLTGGLATSRGFTTLRRALARA